MLQFLISIILVTSSIFLDSANAYTNFIAYGYANCTSCHFNAFGGGPLNDYGRALYATSIAGKVFYPTASDATVANWSGFAGAAKLPDWIRPSIDYRGLQMKQDYGRPREKKVNIDMNTEYNVVLKYGKNDKMHYSFSLAQYPEARTNSTTKRDKFISRENYFSYKFKDDLRVQAGVFEYLFGLRVPDHIVFSKTVTGIAENDQTMGTAVYYNRGILEGGAQLFIGNPNDEDDTKLTGLSIKNEFKVSNNAFLGFSGLKGSNDYVDKTMFSAQARVGFAKGGSLLAEIGKVLYEPKTSQEQTENVFFFSQSMMRLFRGFHFLTTFESNSAQSGDTQQTIYRFAPGFAWFPVQRVEIRSEVYNTRMVSNNTVLDDQWDWYTNIHLSF